jgi:RNA 3'-terminal phosphate cyclase-like protein
MRIPALEVRPFDQMIENLCSKVEHVRLREQTIEISLLRLLERVTNGTVIEISVTGAFTPPRSCVVAERRFFGQGTAILLKPGIIAGGPVTHECPLSRSIGYFLEPVIMIAPFSKKPLDLTLKGVTTDDNDLSVSTTRRDTKPDCMLINKRQI